MYDEMLLITMVVWRVPAPFPHLKLKTFQRYSRVGFCNFSHQNSQSSNFFCGQLLRFHS
jgi:hypothetical protein